MSTKKLRILFLPKWYPNEMEALDGNFIENYVKALQSTFDLSVLFVHSEVKESNEYRVENKKPEGYNEVHVYFKKATSPFQFVNKLVNALRYRKAQRIAYQEFPKTSFDLCHIHVLSRTAFLALSLKRTQNIPFVISEHWSGYHAHVREYKGILKKLFTQYVVQKASAIHAVSNPLKQSMQAHQLTGKYHIIPNVVDTKLFHSSEVKSDSDKVKILFVGNLLQRPKRILDIIESIAEIAKKRKDFHLSIYGEGSDEEKCKRLIEKLQLNGIVELMGTRTRAEIARVMASSNFLILFSEFENQPCVINEAQACGLPVVVPNIEGIEERMRPELGIVFQKNDKNAFIDALEKMLSGYKEYNAQTIRAFAEKEYSETSIAEQFSNFYKSALNQVET